MGSCTCNDFLDFFFDYVVFSLGFSVTCLAQHTHLFVFKEFSFLALTKAENETHVMIVNEFLFFLACAEAVWRMI